MEETDQSHAQADLPTGKRPSIHWLGDCVVPGVGLDIVEKKKIPFPDGIGNLYLPAHSLITILTVLL